MQGEFAAREDAARELGVVTDRLQGSGNLQEDERAMLLRKQDQLTHTLEQHSTQVTSPSLRTYSLHLVKEGWDPYPEQPHKLSAGLGCMRLSHYIDCPVANRSVSWSKTCEWERLLVLI